VRALLLILDGVGLSEPSPGNAVTAESMPFFFELMDRFGVASLEASGEPVGLQKGHTGNSEVGHLTIGAGRRVSSVLESMKEAYSDGSWRAAPAWSEITNHDPLHIVGLLSDAGVHGYWPNLMRSARLALEAGVSHVYLHPILDGVDAQGGSAPRLLAEFSRELEEIPGAIRSSVMGRRWACDRSGNLEITQVLVDHLKGRHPLPKFSQEALAAHLATGAGEKDFPCHRFPGHRAIGDGEAVLIANNRADRTRQVAQVFGVSNPVYSLVELDGAVPRERVFFPKEPLHDGIEFELQKRKLSAVRIAEQCKFPHVTYFFNGFNETLGEESICIPSIPEDQIAAQPEMSTREVADAIIAQLGDSDRRAIVANIANADQVGHLGDSELAARATRNVDDELMRIHAACSQHGWTLLVTSDHGNADTMIDAEGRPFGSHSTSPVPLMVAPAPGAQLQQGARTGSLANVAATFLTALGLDPPDWMAASLIQGQGQATN
jgi:2,3-bisphosphoglycerate-independent phosphoglycerate mutase